MADVIKRIAQNRQAHRDYFVIDTYEAGISLSGTEVKSIRQGKVNLRDCYAAVEDGNIIVHGMHISPYEKGNIFNKDPLRNRQLLLHRQEIRKLSANVQQKGLSMVPLQLYFKNGKVKVELALVQGKKLYDKRHDIAARDAQRDIERSIRNNQ